MCIGDVRIGHDNSFLFSSMFSAHQRRGEGYIGGDLSLVLSDLEGGEVTAGLLLHHQGLGGEAHAHTERVVENIS